MSGGSKRRKHTYIDTNKDKHKDKHKDKDKDHLLLLRIGVLNMTIEKLKFEKSNISSAKDILLSSRKNIKLHTKILKIKYERLKRELGKRIPKENSDDSSSSSSSLCSSSVLSTKKLSSSVSTFKKPEEEKVLENKKIQKASISSPIKQKITEPSVGFDSNSSIDSSISCKNNGNETDADDPQAYVLLMPADKKSTEECKNKKIYIDKIFDFDVQEHFELVSEDPFEILPLNREVPIQYAHLQALKPHVLKWAASGAEMMPTISLKLGKQAVAKKNKGSSKQPVLESIDLTDGDAENDCSVSDKRKLDETDESCAKKPRNDQIKNSNLSTSDSVAKISNNGSERSNISTYEDIIDIS